MAGISFSRPRSSTTCETARNSCRRRSSGCSPRTSWSASSTTDSGSRWTRSRTGSAWRTCTPRAPRRGRSGSALRRPLLTPSGPCSARRAAERCARADARAGPRALRRRGVVAAGVDHESSCHASGEYGGARLQRRALPRRVAATYDDGLHLQAARPSMRFQQLLERVGYVNAQFGLLRAEVLRRTGLLGSYPAADVVFVAQLSLHGTFWEVPSFLFYRRFHPGAASRMDRAQLRVVWDPTSRRRVHLPEWRYLLELARAIAWAPIGLAEQLRAGRFLARRAIWNRDKLAREVWAAMRQLATAAVSET